jgi:hypothetical protein
LKKALEAQLEKSVHPKDFRGKRCLWYCNYKLNVEQGDWLRLMPPIDLPFETIPCIFKKEK